MPFSYYYFYYYFRKTSQITKTKSQIIILEVPRFSFLTNPNERLRNCWSLYSDSLKYATYPSSKMLEKANKKQWTWQERKDLRHYRCCSNINTLSNNNVQPPWPMAGGQWLGNHTNNNRFCFWATPKLFNTQTLLILRGKSWHLTPPPPLIISIRSGIKQHIHHETNNSFFCSWATSNPFNKQKRCW